MKKSIITIYNNKLLKQTIIKTIKPLKNPHNNTNKTLKNPFKKTNKTLSKPQPLTTTKPLKNAHFVGGMIAQLGVAQIGRLFHRACLVNKNTQNNVHC